MFIVVVLVLKSLTKLRFPPDLSIREMSVYLDFSRFAFGNGSASALKSHFLKVFNIKWYGFVVTVAVILFLLVSLSSVCFHSAVGLAFLDLKERCFLPC